MKRKLLWIQNLVAKCLYYCCRLRKARFFLNEILIMFTKKSKKFIIQGIFIARDEIGFYCLYSLLGGTAKFQNFQNCVENTIMAEEMTENWNDWATLTIR